MKVKIFAVIALVLAGITVTVMMLKGQAADQEEYAGYLAAARQNADRDIPYVAVQNYLRAIHMDAGDEGVYQEYLIQAKNLGVDPYMAAVKSYVEYFPESSMAYEALCEYYYNQEMYRMVLDTALEAREKGIATDRVREYYLECSVMYRVIGSGYSEVTSFLGETARVRMGELYGYINQNGNYTMMPTYEDASFFMGKNAAVYHEDEWYMINEAGYKVARTNLPVDYLSFVSNGWILFSLEGRYDYMTSSLTVPQEIRFEDATNFKNRVAAVKKDGKWALINANMEMITDYLFDDVLRDEFNTCINNGVIFVQKDGKYYMVNEEGLRITETGFDNACPFVGSDPAAVCVNGLWGFVDAQGNMVIEPQYEAAKSFNMGLGAVCRGGLWGYINTGNVIRMEYQFEDCLPFSSNGVTAVRENDTWRYIKLLPYI